MVVEERHPERPVAALTQLGMNLLIPSRPVFISSFHTIPKNLFLLVLLPREDLDDEGTAGWMNCLNGPLLCMAALRSTEMNCFKQNIPEYLPQLQSVFSGNQLVHMRACVEYSRHVIISLLIHLLGSLDVLSTYTILIKSSSLTSHVFRSPIHTCSRISLLCPSSGLVGRVGVAWANEIDYHPCSHYAHARHCPLNPKW